MVVARGIQKRRPILSLRSYLLVLLLSALLLVHHYFYVPTTMIIGTSFHGSGSSNPREVSISNESSSWVEEGSPRIPWSPIRQSNCSISCPTIRQKMMATQEWPPDPNDGTLFSRNIVVPTTTTTEKQSSSSKSFIISVHNETYDPVRWKSIYKQGTYYETLVQERFVNILSTNHNHHPLTSIVVDVGANIGYYIPYSVLPFIILFFRLKLIPSIWFDCVSRCNSMMTTTTTTIMTTIITALLFRIEMSFFKRA